MPGSYAGPTSPIQASHSRKWNPFIQSELIQHWQSENHTIFLSDSTTSTQPLPVLSYSIEKLTVSYERQRKKRVQRQLNLTTHYTLSSTNGQVEADSVCTKTTLNVIERDALSAVESDAFPITKAPHPPKSWMQRYIEPVVLTTATVLGVYLFFTLRSDSNDDGT